MNYLEFLIIVCGNDNAVTAYQGQVEVQALKPTDGWRDIDSRG
jgi:hypothetical protein